MPLRTTEIAEKAQKERYLHAFRQIATLTTACRAAKVSPNTVYKWRELDDQFLFAENQAREACADELEASVIKRAKGRSDILAMFMLKAMRPEKYREQIGVKYSGVSSIEVRAVDYRAATAALAAGSDEDLSAPG